MFSLVWKYIYEKAARNFFKKWYWWATHSRLKPITEAKKDDKRHLDNILTYLKYKITNAVDEGINSKIQQMNQQQGDLETLRIIGLLSCSIVES